MEKQVNVNIQDGVVTGGIHIHNGDPKKPSREDNIVRRPYEGLEFHEPISTDPLFPWGRGQTYEESIKLLPRGWRLPKPIEIYTLIMDGKAGKLTPAQQKTFDMFPADFLLDWENEKYCERTDGGPAWTWSCLTAETELTDNGLELKVWESDTTTMPDKTFLIPYDAVEDGVSAYKGKESYNIPYPEELPDKVTMYFWGVPNTHKKIYEDLWPGDWTLTLGLPNHTQGKVPLLMKGFDLNCEYDMSGEEQTAGTLAVKPIE